MRERQTTPALAQRTVRHVAAVMQPREDIGTTTTPTPVATISTASAVVLPAARRRPLTAPSGSGSARRARTRHAAVATTTSPARSEACSFVGGGGANRPTSPRAGADRLAQSEATRWSSATVDRRSRTSAASTSPASSAARCSAAASGMSSTSGSSGAPAARRSICPASRPEDHAEAERRRRGGGSTGFSGGLAAGWAPGRALARLPCGALAASRAGRRDGPPGRRARCSSPRVHACAPDSFAIQSARRSSAGGSRGIPRHGVALRHARLVVNARVR